jgi:L-seryl-tRNA(Ser) seleniumtransferase
VVERNGRGGRIRTFDLLVPNQALYQAEPRPDVSSLVCCTPLAQARTIEFVSDTQKLRELPAVHEVLEQLAPSLARFPRALVVSEVRRAIDAARAEILSGKAGEPAIAARVERALADLERPSLRPVINATGVVLHTNLGRAPLGTTVVHPGYCNLEYDLETGRRGQRDVHTSPLLERLLGAPAIAVNNNAAAVFLALHELAAGGEAIVSRGELIEIGDGFRIPDIMAHSGATLREVGTTNRTRIEDYRDAVTDRTRLLMRVHPSNFRISGFTARPDLRELTALGRECGIPVYEDLGSGCVVDQRAFGIDEPLVSDSLSAGMDLVSFSGDKLLGGPQAGILAGRPELIARLRRNPLYRALRLDKVICQLLENTLRSLLLERWDEVPTLAMLRQPAERIRERALALIERIPALRAEVIPGQSVIGGGATPDQSIPTWVIAVECKDVVEAERKLRTREDSIVARIEYERLILDLRTVFFWEEDSVAAALRELTQL